MQQHERAYPRLHWSVRTALRPLITAHGQITAFELACGGNGNGNIVNSPSSSTISSISSTCSSNSGSSSSNGSNQQKRHRRSKTNSSATTPSSQKTDENNETDEEPVLWGGSIARWDSDHTAVSSSRARCRTFALRRRRLFFARAVRANDQRCVDRSN